MTQPGAGGGGLVKDGRLWASVPLKEAAGTELIASNAQNYQSDHHSFVCPLCAQHCSGTGNTGVNKAH